MPDESNVLPATRIVRWVAIGALILFGVVLYFRDGRRLAPLTAPPPAPASAAAPGAPSGN